MNDARAGWRKFAIHFFGLGVPVGAVVWFGGWSGAVVLLVWRGYEEYRDWRGRWDTAGKAAIDLLSQVLLPVAVAVWRGLK